MKTKKFTLLQLFSVVDGRLSTNIDDVYDILNHVFNTSVWTHEIPAYMDRLKAARPLWFAVIEGELDTLKRVYKDDFNTLMRVIEEEMNIEFDIPQL
jgi:hypothetical protein